VSPQPHIGPAVIDTTVFGSALTPTTAALAAQYDPLIAGCVPFISFVTLAELRFGAHHAGWGPARLHNVGRSPEKMKVALAVLESHRFAATGVFSEDEARRAIADHEQLFAVIAGGSIDEAGQARLRAAAAPKGAVLITASIGHDDPAVHFTEHVVPKLIEARERVR
jgi:hypothetical protein